MQDTPEPTNALRAAERLHPYVVFVAAVLARLPALGAWWTRDDWARLAGAAGLDAGGGTGAARWLGEHLAWDLTWPLFGLAPQPYAVLRLVLHGLCAVFTLRLARRAGLGPAGGLAAGLIVAATPLSFTPTYWATGIGQLLGTALALLAVERWLAGRAIGRRALATAAGLAVAAMFADDVGLALPLLFIVFLWLGLGVRLVDKAFAWALTMALLAAAVGELVLVTQAPAGANGTATGAAQGLPAYGWWLLSPGPLLARDVLWPMGALGTLFFGVWALWGYARWRQGTRLPLLALGGALCALAPAVFLAPRAEPHLAYAATAAWGLAVASLLPAGLPVPHRLLAGAAVLAAAWGYGGMQMRLDQRTAGGRPAEPVVAATSLSWDAARTLRNLPVGPGGAAAPVVLLQAPSTADDAVPARDLGERWVPRSELYLALGGPLGPRLLVGTGRDVRWASGLVTAPADALVYAATDTGLRFWGPTPQACLYAALTDVARGEFERARRHLARAAALNDERIPFVFDEGQLTVSPDAVLRRRQEFVAWSLTLLDAGSSRQEVGGLQEMFFRLLAACTGRSYAEVTAGSRLLTAPTTPDSSGAGDMR